MTWVTTPIGGDMTTQLQPVEHTQDVALAPAFESKAVTRVRGLGDLMSRRPELAGVYSPADVATEAVRWSA
ncbi:hypothetical protein ABLE68_08025 [Nocardioides sp. CN2-186]|uniref:hypothetical protein n=1 Tax=Nocardioides tweenelious TaxID=3156607 RepID=UPI0032B409F0